MGWRNRGFLDEANDTVSKSSSLSDALLFTTLCIIGFPVDVIVKDGSVFSGIFYTACVDDNYAIVLKKARMIKKGNRVANVGNGSLVETLIVQAEDLVQVVAKRVPLPANGILGDVNGNDVEASVGDIQFPDSEAKAAKLNESNVERKQRSLIRQAGCGLTVKQSHGEEKVKYGEQIANRLHIINSDGDAGKNMSTAVRNVLIETGFKGLPSSVPSHDPNHATVKLDDHSREMHFSEETSHSNTVSCGASTNEMPVMDVSPETRVGSLASIESVPPKHSSCNRLSKESKLNPGAKIFSPSVMHQRSVTPAIPVMPTVTYIPDPSLVVSAAAAAAAADQEYGISPFAPCSSMTVKYVPYKNLVAGNSSIRPQYGYPVTGHIENKIQPVRYSGQYRHSPAGAAFVHPNSQNVMVGRMGAVVYMPPLAQDVHTAVGFSQVSARPLQAPYQVYLPKHQGSAAAQALQLCTTPPLEAGGQQPYVTLWHAPISQPNFHVTGPISGPNGFLSSKLARS